MKTIQNIIITICLLVSSLTFSQDDLKARVEFEEAEKQFNENNFSEAIQYLEKTEVLLAKWTPKVSFMKIEAFKEMADLYDLENENTKKLTNEVAKYMDFANKQKENIVMEKFKVVYAIDEELKRATKQIKKQALEEKTPEYVAGKKAYDEKNYTEALRYWTTGAEKGNVTAMYKIGKLYIEINDNSEEAIKWSKKAIENGNTKALILMADIYHWGMGGIAINYAEAMNWYTKAADKGEINAFYSIGSHYSLGYGVTRSNTKAMEWFKKGADKGDTSSMNSIAIIYYYKGDYAKAMEWYKKSADKGNTSAMKSIGKMYYEGVGVTQDNSKALEWFEKGMKNEASEK